MYDTIIVGAGTAGLTAAIYLRRASKKVLVFEAKSYGGQIINASIIDNYPAEPHISGFDFATKLYNQAKELGSEIRFEKVVNIEDGDIKKVITEKDTYECKTIILATGSDNRKLGLEDEDKLIGKGISYCATCDGNFYKNKVVAVAGGGNSAIEDALYLSNLASKVYVIHRRDEFRAEDKLLNELKEKNNVEFILNSNVTKLNSNDLLESIELTDKDGNKKVINLDGLFIAVGRIPENENFASIVNLNENGYVIATEDCNTNVPGIFVAGDNRTKTVRQLVTAASDGAVAASEAIKYINKNKL
ncbi:MAG: thioredoxin-disulfide reductase [Bacilli bacterium]|nr:thioredoxin-disulfide reductase [Bacilli bacterium]